MLVLKNITAGYGGKTVLNDISLVFPDGKITAIIGANGSGKSTLLKICGGQLAAGAGSVFADGESVLNARQAAKKIAYLPQSRPVPEITVERLVVHGRFPWAGFPRVYTKRDWEIVGQSMHKTGIYPKRRELLSQLSGGERQKAYIAMALAQETQHILLDEPSSSLDIAVQLELEGILRELRENGKCVVIILHDIAKALELADEIAVIHGGRLLKRGKPDEIISSGAVETAFGVRVLEGKRGKTFEIR